jgi:hypothetical protein
MGFVSENAEDAATDRPWPAPGPDATWWRSDPADAAAPADASDAADGGDAMAETVVRPVRTSPFATPPVIRRVRAAAAPGQAAPTTPAPTTPAAETGPAALAPPEDPLVRQALADEALAEEIELTPAQTTVDGRAIVAPAALPGPRQPQKAMRPPRARPARPPRPPRNPMRPWLAMPALVLLALAASFFAWVSAEPFWLAVGHGARGVATILPAEPAGGDRVGPVDPGRRSAACRASFLAEGGAFTVSRVALAGVSGPACTAGTRLPARMVSADGGRAYPVDHGDLTLRWSIGLLLIVLCGLAITVVTGALRFAGWRRITTTALSLGGPLLVTFGILAATF